MTETTATASIPTFDEDQAYLLDLRTRLDRAQREGVPTIRSVRRCEELQVQVRLAGALVRGGVAQMLDQANSYIHDRGRSTDPWENALTEDRRAVAAAFLREHRDRIIEAIDTADEVDRHAMIDALLG